MNGPNGTAVKPPSFALPFASSAIPISEPTTDEAINVNNTAAGPKNAPMAPMSFTSPNPSASRLKSYENIHPIPHMTRKPNANPSSDDISAARRVASPCSSGTSTLRGTPSNMPPIVTLSGR